LLFSPVALSSLHLRRCDLRGARES